MIKVPNIPCDICGINCATRWFLRTSIVLCSDENCYIKMLKRFEEETIEDTDET